MRVRDATEVDLAAIAAVRLAIDREAHDDSGADPVYCRHLMADGRLLVADDGGRVVGFAGSIDVGPARLLADLFIDPTVQGTGIGQTLLTAVLDGSAARFTFSSSDPRAMPIYARAGMLPRWPLLYLEGSVQRLRSGGLVAASGDRGGIDTSGLRASDLSIARAVAFEQQVTGHDRSAQYRYWAARHGSKTCGVWRDDVLVAAGALLARATMVRVEHLVTVDVAVDHAAVFAAIVHSVPLAERVVAYVPGPRPLTGVLLARGFRIADSDTFMATSDDVVAEAMIVVHPGLG